MISAEFPPETTAGSHRLRLLAPHLPEFGWEPTILTMDARDSEGRLEPELEQLFPRELRVLRSRAWPAKWTRLLRVGDAGARAYRGFLRTCRELLRRERLDALFITVPSYYPAYLGPRLKQEFGIPFVLDYIDPWVGAWGLTVGGGPNSKPDLKSRLARRLAVWSEPRVVPHVDAFTAVSSATYEQVFARNPQVADRPCASIPYGGEIADFDYLRAHPRANLFFDPNDGNCHLCYLGTLLPLGFETLRALLAAARWVQQEHPDLYAKLRLHFFGTSNQTRPGAPQRVLPVAREIGVAEIVQETAHRIDYLDALTVQTQASAILLMGSSERHYTASKLYPALLAQRPILALYHEASSVTEIMRKVGCAPSLRLLTYDDEQRAESQVGAIAAQLAELIADPRYCTADVNLEVVREFSAAAVSAKLAGILDQVVSPRVVAQSHAG